MCIQNQINESNFIYYFLEIPNYCTTLISASCGNTIDPPEPIDRRLNGEKVDADCKLGYQVALGDTTVLADCQSTGAGVGNWLCDETCGSEYFLHHFNFFFICPRSRRK